jgi:hypothetical protein
MIDTERKLRVLVISTEGSERQQYIQELFAQPSMRSAFEPPVFSPSVSSRTLRNRVEFFRIANEAGLIPDHEWEAIRGAIESCGDEHGTPSDPGTLFNCLDNVPVMEGRRGSQSDIKLHYCREVRQIVLLFTLLSQFLAIS